MTNLIIALASIFDLLTKKGTVHQYETYLENSDYRGKLVLIGDYYIVLARRVE